MWWIFNTSFLVSIAPLAHYTSDLHHWVRDPHYFYAPSEILLKQKHLHQCYRAVTLSNQPAGYIIAKNGP